MAISPRSRDDGPHEPGDRPQTPIHTLAAGGTGQAAVASVSTCSAAAIITDETIP